MNTVDREWPIISMVEVDDRWITATFTDGRRVSVPLWWSWRLEGSTAAQRSHWELIADGEGVHWPEVDEDLSAQGFFVGSPAPHPRTRQGGGQADP